MSRKTIITILILLLASLFVVGGCKKKEAVTPELPTQKDVKKATETVKSEAEKVEKAVETAVEKDANAVQ